MATKEFILKAGEPAPESVRSWLEKLYSPAELERMTQRGARVRVSLTSPWPKVPKIPKPVIAVDGAYLERLKSLATNESALEKEVGFLGSQVILEIGKVLGIPMQKKSKVPSLRAQLINSLRSEIVWRGISGSLAPLPTSGTSEPKNTP